MNEFKPNKMKSTFLSFSNPQSNRKHFAQKDSQNPILQEKIITSSRSGKKLIDPKPSPLTLYSNERKYNLPASLGLGNRYMVHYKSQVFEETDKSYLFNGSYKNLLGKPGEVPRLLNYSYALPYKEEKLTPKIGK